MCDVLIVGAGPAGAVAATVLARAGARVTIADRASFPREKLCGDTLNPGSLALLRRLGMAAAVEERGLRVDGMVVTGEGAVTIEGRYPRELHGRAIVRRELDWALLQEALRAGASLEEGAHVRAPLVANGRGGAAVTGVSIANGASGPKNLSARITIAADGRHSTVAFALGLARHPQSPRRWAVGAYFTDARATDGMGEMHIRRGRCIGVAPVPGGLVNVCVVRPSHAGDRALADPAALLRRELVGDPLLRDRFAAARMMTEPMVLGPLAVDALAQAPEGLLLAGDAAGFVDPMTGDGLRFAIRGGELAALAALRVLEHGWRGVHDALDADRRRDFAAKKRFNRALRTLVGSPLAVRAAAAGARVAPGIVRAMIARAGDCP